MSVAKTWTDPTSSPPDLVTGQALTQTAWEMVLSNLDYLGGSNGSGGVIGGVPSGAMSLYGTGTTDPAGWLLCDGRAVSRTTYSALFTAISTLYGSGDGSTTFNIPDFRSRTFMGADNMGTSQGGAGRTTTQGANGLGNTSGEDLHQLSVGELAGHTHSHNHAITDPQHAHTYPQLGGGGGAGTGVSSSNNTTGAQPASSSAATGISLAADSTSTGSSIAHNTRQLTLCANVIIKI